jgi:hypothetical protein
MANNNPNNFVHSLGLGVKILYLQKVEFVVGSYLADVYFLGVVIPISTNAD